MNQDLLFKGVVYTAGREAHFDGPHNGTVSMWQLWEKRLYHQVMLQDQWRQKAAVCPRWLLQRVLSRLHKESNEALQEDSLPELKSVANAGHLSGDIIWNTTLRILTLRSNLRIRHQKMKRLLWIGAKYECIKLYTYTETRFVSIIRRNNFLFSGPGYSCSEIDVFRDITAKY